MSTDTSRWIPASIGRSLICGTLLAVTACAGVVAEDTAPADEASLPGAEPMFPRLDVPPLPTERALTHIAFGSCLHQARPQPILATLAAENPELLLMIGDNVYGDARGASMAPLREAYERQAQSTALTDIRRRIPVIATWDDHDYGLNDAGAGFFGADEARRLFQAFWQIDPARHADATGIADAHVFGPPGRRVQVILLDTRTFRSPLRPTEDRGAPGRERYVPDPDPAKTMLGEAQWRWLERQLRIPADLRLVVTSIQLIADGHGWEAWRTLPAERSRMYRTLAESGADGVVLLSGDRHRAGIYRRTDVIGYPLVEITSSSLNLPITDGEEEAGPYRLGATYLDENYGRMRIDWEAGTLDLEIVDMAGTAVRSVQLALAVLRHAN